MVCLQRTVVLWWFSPGWRVTFFLDKKSNQKNQVEINPALWVTTYFDGHQSAMARFGCTREVVIERSGGVERFRGRLVWVLTVRWRKKMRVPDGCLCACVCFFMPDGCLWGA